MGAQGRRHTFVTNFEWTLTARIGQPSPARIFSQQCGRAVAIEHDGSVFAGVHYAYPEHELGNLLADNLGAMFERSMANGFSPHKESTLPRYCRQCEAKEACWGGRPKHRFATTPDGEPGLPYLYASCRKFFRHTRNHLRAMTTLLESDLPVSLVMQGVDGPLIATKASTDPSAGDGRPRGLSPRGSYPWRMLWSVAADGRADRRQ